MESNERRRTITVPEAGAMLGVSRNKAYALAREGVLPTLKLGRKIVVPRARFEAWLNGGSGASDRIGQ